MRQTRWQPFTPVWNQLQQLESEMNRLFDRLGDRPWFRGLTAGYPAVNIWEDDEAVWLEAELPGISAENLEIQVSGGNQLTLKGERKPSAPDKAVVHRQERGFGKFERVFSLPVPVDPDKVDARFENGVLRVKLGKHEIAKPRKIQVKGE